MQAGTTTVASSTGSKTIADLIGRAAEQYGDRVAARHKVDGAWQDVTYARVGEIVREVGLGLIDLGIEAGERVCLLAKTRVEWTYCDFAIAAAGAVAVPIFQGRIDKTLFLANLGHVTQQQTRSVTA